MWRCKMKIMSCCVGFDFFIELSIEGFPVCSQQVSSFFYFFVAVKRDNKQKLLKSQLNYFHTIGFRWMRKLWFSIGCCFCLCSFVWLFFWLTNECKKFLFAFSLRWRERAVTFWLHCVLFDFGSCVYEWKRNSFRYQFGVYLFVIKTCCPTFSTIAWSKFVV